MKCPKCGYLGFETTDRCRNCQYDFSLTPVVSEPELTLHGDHRQESPVDFDLPTPPRQGDALSATALDLDRLFGNPPPPPAPEPAPPLAAAPVELPPEPVVADPRGAVTGFEDIVAAPAEPDLTMAVVEIDEPPASDLPGTEDADASALPFFDGPLVPPPAARPPLAVRRSTPDVPRNRPRPTRSVRIAPLDFEANEPKSSGAAAAAGDTIASLMKSPSLGVRVGAGLIDLFLLLGIDLAVVYLTLRVTGLQNSLADLLLLPPVPFVGFLAVLAFGYMAAFTVAGGQTIGKMMLNLRVIGDDGRPVDAAGGVLRALGCMLVPLTLGLSYLPALFTSDRRALHDRLAGTRVVRET